MTRKLQKDQVKDLEFLPRRNLKRFPIKFNYPIITDEFNEWGLVITNIKIINTKTIKKELAQEKFVLNEDCRIDLDNNQLLYPNIYQLIAVWKNPLNHTDSFDFRYPAPFYCEYTKKQKELPITSISADTKGHYYGLEWRTGKIVECKDSMDVMKLPLILIKELLVTVGPTRGRKKNETK